MKRRALPKLELTIKTLGLREWKSSRVEAAEQARAATEAREQAAREEKRRFEAEVKANVDRAEALHRQLLAEGLRQRIEAFRRGE